MIKKQLVGITFYAIVIYFTGGLLASAVAVSGPLLRDGTRFCGVSGYRPQWRPDSKKPVDRNYAQQLDIGTPRTVRLIYFLPNDRPYRAEVVQQMKDQVREAQTFFAAQLRVQGLGRKTFDIETDSQGELIVHRVDGRLPDSDYVEDTDAIAEIERVFDLYENVYLIFFDSDLFFGGGYAGSGRVYSKHGGAGIVVSDLSDWGLVAHELGHAFGLLHDFRDGAYIMSYGPGLPDRLSSCNAGYVSVHPYFDQSSPLEREDSPTIELLSPENYPKGSTNVPIRVRVSDSDRIQQVILYAAQPENRWSVKACRGVSGRTGEIEFDYDGVIPSAHDPAYSRGTSLLDPIVHPIVIEAIDTDGNWSGLESELFLDSSLDPIAVVADASPTYSSGELIPTLPTGSYFPNVLAGGSFQSSGGVITITFRNDGLMVVDGITYTCVASGGCRIDGRTVTQGLIQVDGTEGEGPSVDDENIMDTDVDIPDPNLRAAIEGALGKASGASILLSDMANLTALDASNANISDLTGLAAATNLKRLDLGEEYVEAEWDLINSNSISDLSPLAGLTNLIRLDLGYNSIVDISPVAGLTNLTHLSLWSNAIVDISPVAGLTNLTWLYLSSNAIVDISPVAGLTNLTELYLGSNAIVDISPVAGLTNLTELSLYYNAIVDISPVAGLTNLTYLSLWSNAIVDLSPVAGLTNLTTLDLGSNAIVDLSPVAGLTNLTWLYLNSNAIVDISPVAGLTNLTYLYLWNNNITDLSPLVANTGLGSGDQVEVSENPLSFTSINTHIPALQSRGVIVEFDNIVTESVNIPDPNLRAAIESDLGKASGATITTADMERLTYFYPRNANISDLTGLEAAPNLKELGLGGEYVEAEGAWINSNSISDLSPLAGLTNLTRLSLDNNNISDLSPVAGLTQLVDLQLYGNNITDISVVSGLTNLTELLLGGSSIVDISAVAGLTNLRYLHLDTNNITDLSPLVANTGLGSGDQVDVSENPLSFTSINTHIPALQSRGVEVFFYHLKPPTLEYTLSIPAGISLIHVPLKVSAVDGVEQPIESVGDLYAVLGGASTVNYLITYDSKTQAWLSYFSSADSGTLADRTLTDDMGIMAGMKAFVSVAFTGEPLGTGGSGSIHFNQGLNLVGLPLNDSRLNRVSDLLSLDGIRNNVPVIIHTDGGDFEVVGRAGDPADIPLTGGQGFILTAQRSATVALSGEGWTNDSGAGASPSITRKGIDAGNRTPVLELRGAVVDEHTGVSEAGFRVTVKNLSRIRRFQSMEIGESLMGRTAAAVTAEDEAGYRLTVVDIETGRAATIGDTLEISAQSPNPFIGVKPVRYTVTAEDVKRSLIQLPELIAYEIPAETELLANYPNPFNPETWIPYRLAEDAFVTLTIYDQSGRIVRTLDVGHRVAAVYESRSKAIYWDGRNEFGETVASGVYFYHLTGGDYSATRKMLILK